MMKSTLKPLALLVAVVLLAGCDSSAAEVLSASGVVEATEISVTTEIGGRVLEVMVGQGDAVEPGEPLLRIDGRALETQLDQAAAALQSARGNLELAGAAQESAAVAVEMAESGLAAAELEYQIVLNAAWAQERPLMEQALNRSLPSEFSLPAWYFQDAERLEAAGRELAAADAAVAAERENLRSVISEASSAGLVAAEQELADAQAAFLVAEALLDLQIDSQDRRVARDFIDELHEAAEAELESAQQSLESLLGEEASSELLEARARLAVAEQRLAIARDQLAGMRTGEHALEVQAAGLRLKQAELQLRQTEAGRAQADAQIAIAEGNLLLAEQNQALLQLQLEKLEVTAPIAGVVLTRIAEPGEIIQPGITLLTIAQLDELRITVYLPEDRYGQVSLGDEAQVSVDSYPERTFEAVVSRIADQAEFTPRNVQTEEDRRTTVYAVELMVTNPADLLKPGMPADVVFAP